MGGHTAEEAGTAGLAVGMSGGQHKPGPGPGPVALWLGAILEAEALPGPRGAGARELRPLCSDSGLQQACPLLSLQGPQAWTPNTSCAQEFQQGRPCVTVENTIAESSFF